MNLYIDSSGLCGATIISSEYVLTAAHCTEGTSNIDIYFADHSYTNNDPGEFVLTANSVIQHPKYNDTTYDYDIALLRLANNITFNETV